MEFFRAFGNDLGLEVTPDSSPDQQTEEGQRAEPNDSGDAGKENASPKASSAFGGWNLAKTVGHIATLAVKKSEEVLEDYSRDLAEFQATLGLEVKESVQAAKTSLPELATKAAEAGSSAQQQFETIGENIERLGSNVLKSTTELLSSVSEAIDLVEDDASPARSKHRRPLSLEGAAGVAKYNRFEAQVAAMQRDSSTYCDEPEDEEDFQAWQEEFKLDDRQAKIDKLVNENAFMQELQSRIVPDIVDYETFWLRYFYRLHKLQQVQEAREDLVKRATLPEEELSWDVDESPVGKPEVNSESHDVLGTADVSGEAARKGEGSGDRLDGEQVQYGSCLGHAHEAEETYTTPGDVVPEVPEESGDVDGDLAAPAEPPAGGQEAEDQTVRSEASASSSDWTMVSEGTTKASVVSLETEGESIGNESAVEVEHKDGKASDVDEDWGNWE